MPIQIAVAFESVFASTTLMRPALLMNDFDVLLQGVAIWKLHFANTALIWPKFFMNRAYMILQAVTVCSFEVALITLL